VHYLFYTTYEKSREHINIKYDLDDGINSQQWKEKDGRYGSEKNGQKK
jgi:hypothetical protein